MAFSQGSFCLSRETPSTVKFLSRNRLYASTTVGFSLRHGPHQLAQKSTRTYLPRNELRLTSLPSVSGKEISGACLPVNDLLICASIELLILTMSSLPGNLFVISVNKPTSSSAVKPDIRKAGLLAMPW